MVGQSNGPVQVSIKGWRGGTEASLKRFLDTKTGQPVGITDVNYRGDIMYISVPGMGIAQELLRLSGIRFAGDKLTFQIKTHPVKFGPGGASAREAPAGSSDSMAVRDRLVALLQTRVDPQGISLDLASLAQDKIIQSFGVDSLHDKLFEAILVLAAQLYPGIVTVNLEGNELRSLKPVANIGAHFPDLKNLSLMNNQIADLRELNCLSAAGSTVPLKKLNELILQGNPASEAELRLPGGGASYVEKVQQRFPTISVLDRNPVVPQAPPGQGSDARPPPQQLPFPVAQSFVENPDIGELANGFLAWFFGLYDGDRSSLANAYDPSALFSLMVDTTAPTSTFARSNPHSQKRVDFSAYIRVSRNLSRVKGHQKRIRSLVVGKAAVVQFITQLPATQHPVQDAQRFSFDAWQTNVDYGNQQTRPVAMVAVHGEFTEQPSQNVVSFDRIFALAPASPGSPAASMGIPCTVVNDQLTIRRYNGFHSWQPSGGEPANQEMARALQEQTGLNAEWTLKCLENYGWNYAQAVAEFPQVRASLPPEAFQ
ncbi:nuclear mRNA export, poly(A)+RNA binding protein [Coemansia sp. RSA 552]|nr:nuclear mRNA export, poly(A)+RNA binding protein [Coemansia sp. RSA 552]